VHTVAGGRGKWAACQAEKGAAESAESRQDAHEEPGRES